MTDIENLPEQIMYQPLFDLVANKTNWKMPIAAQIRGPHKDNTAHYHLFVQVLTQAIIFYTGSVPEVTRIGTDDKGFTHLQVRAAGYYSAIGA